VVDRKTSPRSGCLPRDKLEVFAFTRQDVTNYSVFDVSTGLRERGRQVPAYTFPANRQDLAALHIVVGEGRGRGMTDLLLNDIAHLLLRPQQQVGPVRGPDARSFVHATRATQDLTER